MIRCGLVELLMPGGGYALAGELRRAAFSIGLFVVLLLASLFTPWAVLAIALARVVAVVDAARLARRGPPARGWAWKPMLMFGAIGLGMSMLARLTALEAFAIPSVSMTPTLQLDDKIMVDKLSINWRAPERGEIVAFWLGPRTFVKRVIAVGGDHVAVRDGVPYVNGSSAVRRAIGRTTYRDRDPQTGRVSREPAFEYEERLAGRTYRVYGNAERMPRPMSDYPQEELGAVGCGGHGPMLEETRTVALTAGTDGTCIVPARTLFVMGDNRDNSNDSRVWGAVPIDRVFGRVTGVWLGGAGQRLGRVGNVE